MFSSMKNEKITLLESSEQKITKVSEELQKKYQEHPDTFLKDYDDMINGSMIGIIANWKTSKILRADLINAVTDLVTIRQMIVDNNSNNSSSNNQR